jgi:oligoendopeptidase F
MSAGVLKAAFEIPGEAFQSITADTFFDPEKKENHVIYCPNLKDGQIHVYNGNKFSTDGWDVVEKKEFFKKMLTNQMRTLEIIKRCNDLDDNPLEINNMVGFANLLKEFNANNDVIKEYTTKLNTLCYKNNPIVKKTKDEIKDIKIKKMLKKALANEV